MATSYQSSAKIFWLRVCLSADRQADQAELVLAGGKE